MSDIQEEQKRLYKKAEENDNINLIDYAEKLALYQIQQRIKMHELEQTTSVENEREKVILNYINKLQNKIDKAIIYMQNYINVEDSMMCESAREEFKEIINILKGE